MHFASSAHSRINHQRKYTRKPYETHLRSVADLVASVTDDQDMISAAWLHDIVEDTAVTLEEIESNFGDGVARLVAELTDISKPSDGDRKLRKAIDRQHTAGISPRAKTIKLADLIDNSLDITQHDPRFARVYLEEMRALLDVLHEGDPKLFKRAQHTLATCTGKLQAVYASQPGHDAAPVLDDNSVFAQQHGIRLFTEAFTAQDILEPLISFDKETMQAGQALPGDTRESVIGIRENGLLTGYLSFDPLEQPSGKSIKPFSVRQVLEVDAPLVDVIHVLTHFSFCFIALNGNVIGVIRRSDIEKPVVRMWLFGMIILIELVVVRWIRNNWPDEGWLKLLSEGRLVKARQLYAERQRRKVAGDLLDCLQFADKMQLLIREPGLAASSGFASIAAAKKAFKQLELLRNNLAHGQEISNSDWTSIVGLARRVYELLKR